MFLRFAAAVGMLTVVALLAIGIEKQNLSLKRAISLQQYQLERLQESHARALLETQRLASPLQLEEVLDANGLRGKVK